MTIAELISVDLRDEWPDEAKNFTPWLADNLPRMLEELGIAHHGVETEQQVGRYRADIVFTDSETKRKVVVENQLTRTDNNHLGQMLTYAAGVNAATVIWVAETFTEEHLAALNWLNDNTHDDLSFIGIEVELWRIDDSKPASRFNVVAKPNNWTRSMRRAGLGELSDIRLMQIKYWQGLRKHVVEADGPVTMTDCDRPRNSAVFAVGKSNFRVCGVMLRKTKQVRAELYILGQPAKQYFEALRSQSEQIQSELGYPLEWEDMPEGTDCRVAIYLDDADPENSDDWDRQHRWLADKLNDLHRVFSARVKALPDPDEE